MGEAIFTAWQRAFRSGSPEVAAKPKKVAGKAKKVVVKGKKGATVTKRECQATVAAARPATHDFDPWA